MELLLVFAVFLGTMALCLALGLTMLLPLGLGLVLFAAMAMRRGHTLRQVCVMAWPGVRDSLLVVRILLLIGCLTGLWRCCGTIPCFITWGVTLMPPAIFVLAAFLLAAVMSFALGTSFGVSATCGTILMAIARAGGVDPVVAAGAILSGVYVGDRGSPSSSCANLNAVLTGTDMRDNVKRMLRTAALPFGLCCLLYGLLSLRCPMQSADLSLLDGLRSSFALGWPCLVPAVLMLVLPFCRVPVKWSMVASILVSAALAVFYQHMGLWPTLRVMLLGYAPENAALAETLSGGGVSSMLEVSAILLVSGCYGGIFRGTDLLAPLTEKLSALSRRLGRFAVMILLGFGVSAVFCNQTISVIMQNQLAAGLYGDDPAERQARMLDIADSVTVIAGLVPWCIASSVPRSMLGVGVSSIPLTFYLWLLPLYRLLGGLKKRKTA